MIIGRHRSGINTDWFPKWKPKAQAFRGVQGACSPIKVFGFYISKFPFPGHGFLSHSDRKLASSIPFGWSLANRLIISSLDFNLESFLLLLLLQIWLISVKRWKPVWIRAWSVPNFYDIKVHKERTEASTSSFLTLFADLHQPPHCDTAKIRLI